MVLADARLKFDEGFECGYNRVDLDDFRLVKGIARVFSVVLLDLSAAGGSNVNGSGCRKADRTFYRLSLLLGDKAFYNKGCNDETTRRQ